MPQFDTRPFVPQTNLNIVNAIRKTASTDYRANIPVATQANLTDTIGQIMGFEARRNEFISALINRIGLVIARQMNWTNPLGKFKRGILTYGETIEEIQVGLLKAHEYSAEREYLERDLFGTEIPDVRSAFHTRNRQNFYKLTVNEQELHRAFLEEGGLSGFIAQLMSTINTTDQWHEYLLTTRLFREFYDAGGFFKVNVPDVSNKDSTSDESKAALRSIRAMTDNLPFISTHYNSAGMPIAAQRDELELFVTPEFNAAVDVEALAAAFNIERAQISTRQTVVRQQDMNIPGAQAILSTRDFFVIADTYYDTAAVQNPVGRTVNHILHHDQIVSVSPFAPAILFTTEPGDVITLTDPVLSGVGDIVIEDRDGDVLTSVPRGDFFRVSASHTSNPEGTGIDLPVLLTLSGAQSSYTKLSQNGTLFVGVDETAAQLTITAADRDGVPSKIRVVNLTGEVIREFPNPAVLPQPEPANPDGS